VICFNRFCKLISSTAAFNSHSQTTNTFHPACLSFTMASTSLSMFLLILFIHHSFLVLGTTKYRQFEWPCQKHPLMNMAVLYLGSKMSGFPGKFLMCRRYLKPSLKRNFRTISSGLVSLPLILLMLKDRCSFECTSDI